jgi:hypothetical protein
VVETASWRAEALKRPALAVSRRASAIVARRPQPRRSSCWRGRCPQSGDQRQDICEHLSWHCDLGPWKVTYRPWPTTFAPILISFSRRLVNDQGSAALGSASVLMKLPRLYARTCNWRRTALAAKVSFLNDGSE